MLSMLRRCPGKDELGVWIDEIVNQPGRTYTIDLETGPDNPGFTLIILGSQPPFSLRRSSIGFERFRLLKELRDILPM
jgi:hypothetical protein